MALRRFLIFLVGALLALSLTGCVGPIWSTVDISNAEKALDQAKKANADQHAPYEYTMAQEYLRKAQEEWGYSEFEIARDYADKARDFAEQARKKADTDPWNGPPQSAISE